MLRTAEEEVRKREEHKRTEREPQHGGEKGKQYFRGAEADFQNKMIWFVSEVSWAAAGATTGGAAGGGAGAAAVMNGAGVNGPEHPGIQPAQATACQRAEHETQRTTRSADVIRPRLHDSGSEPAPVAACRGQTH